MRRGIQILQKNIAGLLAALATACSTEPTRHELEWEQKKQGYISQLRAVNCQDPSMTLKHLGNCNTVTETFFTEYGGMEGATCSKTASKKDCVGKMIEVLFSRLQLAYPYADWKAANIYCTSDPDICNLTMWQGWSIFELQLIKTHNRAVHKIATADRETIQAQANLDALERQRAYLEVIRSMQSERTRQSISCTSTQLGAVTTTNCH